MTKTAPQFPHLRESAIAQLSLPNPERIRAIEAGSWLPLKHAKTALEKFEALLNHPTVTRPPAYLLVGPSYSGKTSILERFMFLHPPGTSPDGESTQCPVVMIDAPPKPDISEFYASILDKLMAPYKPTSPSREKLSQIHRLFREMGVRVLIIDEIQHLIAGSLNRQREFRNALKSLTNTTKVSVIASGIEESYNAFNADSQLSSRFSPIEMPRWAANKDLGELLMTLERRTPLRKPSGLHEPKIMTQILAISEGTIGDICDLIKKAAVDAVQKGTEQITEPQLESLDWVPPSKRKMYRRPL